jgi:hypothetical protein
MVPARFTERDVGSNIRLNGFDGIAALQSGSKE